MGIGSVTSTNNMSSAKMLTAVSTDSKINSIQNKITDAKQQMQKISPKEDLSVNEKEIERKKLQKEISSLNTELKQHQEALSKSQKREILMAELQEDQEQTKEKKTEDKIQTADTSLDNPAEKNLPTDKRQAENPGTVIVSNSDGTVIYKGKVSQDEKPDIDAETKQTDETREKGIAEKEDKTADGDTAKDTGLSHKKIYSFVSADSAVDQANRQGAIIARTRDGIAVLKGEINQDEKRGVDTERKQAELKQLEKKEQRAISFQASILGEAHNTMKSAADTADTETNAKTWGNAKSNAFFNSVNISQKETQAAQQDFYVSFG